MTSSSTTTVDVQLNGETHSITLDGSTSVDSLKRRLSTLSGIPSARLQLVCAGEVLHDDEQCVRDLRRTSLFAWTPRYSKPFVITTLIVLMLSNLGERKPGEASAYTVFNDGMQALPGQLRMEDFEGELRGA